MQKRVVAIGVFDGVHRGHQALIAQTLAIASSHGLATGVLTFNPHPMTVVRGMSVPALSSIERRTSLIKSYGIDEVFVCDFSAERAAQSAEQFIQEVLKERLNAQHIVVGKGFRFGHRAAGTANTLREAGLVVSEVEQVSLHGERVSSTRIREAIQDGKVSQAQELLTRPHRLEGVVVSGHKRGRELGYPTANLRMDFLQAVPADGVYAGWLKTTSEMFPAAISVGTNPTFTDVSQRVVEAYCIDVHGIDLYDQTVSVDFVEFVRGMQAFSSLEELIEAMSQDVARCRTIVVPR